MMNLVLSNFEGVIIDLHCLPLLSGCGYYPNFRTIVFLHILQGEELCSLGLGVNSIPVTIEYLAWIGSSRLTIVLTLIYIHLIEIFNEFMKEFASISLFDSLI